MITDEDKERVRQATDPIALVSETVQLKPRGNDYWGCCPFHHEKSPSFHVNASTGLWHCFGCSEGGDVFAYVMRREGLDFPDAIRYLADRANIELSEEAGRAQRGSKRARLLEALSEAEAFYTNMLLRSTEDGPAAGRAYFGGRGFGSALCRRWSLGYAPGHQALVNHLVAKGFTRKEIIDADLAVDRNGYARDRFYDRVMFPIHDERGRCIGFGGRVLTDAKPKYLNTRETTVFHKSKHLFAFDRAKEGIVAQDCAIVVEGYTDVIAMHEAGFTNVVATLGTALSHDHIKLLSRFAKTIICMFDGDAAGQRAAEAAIQYLPVTQSDLRCVVLPENKDPMEFISAYGADAMRPHLEASRPLIDFVFDKRLEGYDLRIPGVRVAAMGEMAQLLAPLGNTVLVDDYAMRLADAIGTTPEEAKRAIRSARPAMPADVPTPSAGPVDEPPYDDYVPDDYVPDDGAAAPAADPAPYALSADERRQLDAERELLSLMASNPQSFREHAMRIGSFTWDDPRHEAIAWAILATPEDSSAADVVAAATAAEPTAAQILSGGHLAYTSSLQVSDTVSFLLATVELFSLKRSIRQIRAALQGSESADNSLELLGKASEMQKRVNKLSEYLKGMTNASNLG